MAWSARERSVIHVLRSPKFAVAVAAIAVCLALPSLFIGFYMDDYVARYVYSNLPGAEQLCGVVSGGFGLADGNPSHNHWLVEQGYAPWWMYDHLLVRFFRPIAQLSHRLDIRLFRDSALLMHAHSLAWFGMLIVATARLYRRALAPVTAALAAVLFAFDHGHGFVAGYIANRHALISATFGVACLASHIQQRRRRDHSTPLLGPAWYCLALLAGESAVAVLGYLAAHALFVERTRAWRRVQALIPYLLVTGVWHVAYSFGGYGASGSGLYIDPMREPMRFATALLERAPILNLAQFLFPPAEAYVLVDARSAHLLLILAWCFAIALGLALLPLLAASRTARFWLVGFAWSLVPAAGTFPHNRQLTLASVGAMALLAQLWQLYAVKLRDVQLPLPLWASRSLGATLLAGHLFVSPFALPIASIGIAFTAFLHTSTAGIDTELGGHDAVFVNAPEYFTLTIAQAARHMQGKPMPRRWRALSFGPTRVRVRRTDERSLELEYEDGILTNALMEIYRARKLAMHPGDGLELHGLSIRVQSVTADGRVARAAFHFDRALEHESLRFFAWTPQGYVRFVPPRVGDARELAAPPAWGQTELERAINAFAPFAKRP